MGGIVSWCDKLASRPTVGLLFTKHFRPSTVLIEKIAPLLDNYAGKVSDKFSIARQDAFLVACSTENGFVYTLDSQRVSVEFQHRVKLKPVSAGIPTVEMLTKAEPYTVMLEEVSRRALEAANLIINPANRTLERIGVMTTTVVAESDAPPGILKYIDLVRKPWTEANNYQVQIASKVSTGDSWKDQCLHLLAKPETDDDELLTITFDYQRLFNEPKRFQSVDSLKSILTSVKTDALKYFEELAEGSMFDERDDAK